jgi:hypothetical protein
MATAAELDRRRRLDEMEFVDVHGEVREYDREHHVTTVILEHDGRPVICLGMSSFHEEDPAPESILLPIEQLDLIRELFGDPDNMEEFAP